MVNESAVDPNDLIRQFDAVSRSQRSLFAEFQRQQSRLIQLVRLYEHQKLARDSEMRREFEQLRKQTRRQVGYRSPITMRERSRLNHILDPEIRQIIAKHPTQSLSPKRSPTQERKRRTYGCLLSEFKAPLKKVEQNEEQKTIESRIRLAEKYRSLNLEEDEWEKQQSAIIEQRQRIEAMLRKCINGMRHDDGLGYDHFLPTKQSRPNAQIHTQQLLNRDG